MRRTATDDPRQQSLFERSAPVPSRGISYFDLEWRGHMTRAIKESGKGREQVASEMEELLGADPDYPVSKAQLDAFTASSKSAWRFPVIYLPEFIQVTGADWLFDVLARRCGRLAVTEVESQVLEISRLKQALADGNRRLRELLKAKAGQ